MATKTKTAPLPGLQDPDFDGMLEELNGVSGSPVLGSTSVPEKRGPGRPSVPTRQFTIRVTDDVLETLIDMAYAESKRRRKHTTPQVIVVDAVEKLVKGYRKKQEQNG